MTEAWAMDNGPDTTDCDLGQHDWGDADECELCDDDRCLVVCRRCGEENRACEDD